MKKSDPTLFLAAVAIIAAAAAYVGAAMFNAAAPEAEESPAPTVSVITLDGIVLRRETAVYRESESCCLIPREGEFVSGGEVICVDDDDAYFAALDLGESYGGKVLHSPVSGYFCTDLDGFESASVENCLEFSPQSTDNALCRIVYGASWYFVASDPDGAFTESETVTLTLMRSYPATVQSAENGIVVFRVREGLYSVLSLRHETATVKK